MFWKVQIKGISQSKNHFSVFQLSTKFAISVKHKVGSLVYVKRRGRERSDMAAFPNGANGGAACNMCDYKLLK